MTTSQAAILAPVPPVGRYILFTLATDATPATLRESLARLKPLVDGEHTLLALGPQLVQALGAEVPGLREFPALKGPGVDVPSSVATRRATCCCRPVPSKEPWRLRCTSTARWMAFATNWAPAATGMT